MRFDRAELFGSLRPTLTGDATASHESIGESLGMSAEAVKVGSHRLRRRYRDALRREIAETVSDPAEIDAELRVLCRALTGSA